MSTSKRDLSRRQIQNTIVLSLYENPFLAITSAPVPINPVFGYGMGGGAINVTSTLISSKSLPILNSASSSLSSLQPSHVLLVLGTHTDISPSNLHRRLQHLPQRLPNPHHNRHPPTMRLPRRRRWRYGYHSHLPHGRRNQSLQLMWRQRQPGCRYCYGPMHDLWCRGGGDGWSSCVRCRGGDRNGCGKAGECDKDRIGYGADQCCDSFGWSGKCSGDGCGVVVYCVMVECLGGGSFGPWSSLHIRLHVLPDFCFLSDYSDSFISDVQGRLQVYKGTC